MNFFFSHIPKCGGTHICELLGQAYGDGWFPNVAEVARSQNRGWPDLSVGHWVGVTGHYGHELLELVNLPPDLPTFTWIRDPLMRRLSSVFHKARFSHEGSRPIAPDFWDNEEELAFIRHRFLTEDDALYSKFWGGYEERIDFVGRMENMETDWPACVIKFGFPPATLVDVDQPHNSNPVIPVYRYQELLDLLQLDVASVCREAPVFEREFEVYHNLLKKAEVGSDEGILSFR